MNKRSQVATTAIAILLALLAAGAIIGVSPTGIGQTVTVTPGSDTKIVNTITVADGMLINITNSTCIITDPAYATTVVSPMVAEGSNVVSPYSNCLPLGLDLGYITDVKANFKLGGLGSGGYNESEFVIENGLLQFYFSPIDTMRILINETGNYTDFLRLGWINEFISGQRWDNKTDARFIDQGNTKIIQINFTTPDGYLIHNVSMSDNSPSINFVFQWHDWNLSKNSTMYPTWYPEAYKNISHPNYSWPLPIKMFDTIQLMVNNEISYANESKAFCGAEFWDSTKNRTEFTMVVDSACGAAWNSTEIYDDSIKVFDLLHFEEPYIDMNSTRNSSHYQFTIIPDQTQTCIGAGTFNMTCSFTPVREGNHTVDMFMEYYYVNQSGGSNATETLNKSDWFWVESEAPAGCDTGPTCDIACNWLLGHSCDCNEECISGYCFSGVCSSPAPPLIIPPSEMTANFTVSYPETVHLYVNETNQFRVDIENTGELTLHLVSLSSLPSNTSLRVVPSEYSSIEIADKRSFLISTTPEHIINETITFVVETDDTEPSYFTIDFLVSDAPPLYNTTSLLYRLNQVDYVFNDTVDIINFLNEYGYDMDLFSVMLYEINQNISICQNQIMTGNYEQAYLMLQALSSEIEDVYFAMQFLSFREAEIPEWIVYLVSFELAASITVLILLLIVRRSLMIRAAIIMGIINIAVVTLFFYIIQNISPFYYFVGVLVGLTVFFMTKSMLGIQKKLFPHREAHKIFLFTLIYFIVLTAGLFGLISVSNLIGTALDIPLISSFQTQGESYTIPVVTFSRDLEKISMGPGTVTKHKVPPDTFFNMTLIMESSATLYDDLVDYFPNIFQIVDSYGGVVSEYNQFYNNIVWETYSPGTVTYQLISPSQEGRYYFGKANFNESFERESYFVDVVNTTNHISASYLQLSELDGSTSEISATKVITINSWSSTISYDSDIVKSEIFMEIPWISSDRTEIKIDMMSPDVKEICTINAKQPGTYSCEFDLEKSSDISSLEIQISSSEGTATIDYVYLVVDLLEPPEIVISEMSFYPEELEIGETAEYIFVQIENNGESIAEDVNLELILQYPGSQKSETFRCGDMGSGEICPIRFDNRGNGFEINYGEYSLYSNISWKYGSSAVIRPVFNIVDTESGIFGRTNPSIIRLGNTSRYIVSFDNKWNGNLKDVNISISCPGLECYCAEINSFGRPYCDLSTLNGKERKEFSFIIYAPGDVEEDLYNISTNISYTNPNNNKGKVDNTAGSWLSVNSTYFWKDLVFDFTSSKKDFKSFEIPDITLYFEDALNNGFVPDEIFVDLIDPDGKFSDQEYSVNLGQNGFIDITLSDTRSFRPGKYKIKTTATESGFNYTDEYDFSWGLVSVNTERSIYSPGDNATLIIVVLDEYGHLVQNANITVEITDPNSIKSIYHRDPLDDVGTGIDTYTRGIYLVNYTTSVEGNYTVSAVSYFGEPFSFDTYFTVLSDYDFDIIRHVPSTIDPNIVNLTSSIEVISLKSSNLFDITEYLPLDFNVTAPSADNENNKLTWHNMANNSIVSYEAEIPKKSPMLYILGPAEVDGFAEARPWYLAIDPAELYYGANASGTISSGCTPTEGTLSNTVADEGTYFRQGEFDWAGASAAWGTEVGYIDVRLGVALADIEELHITWNGLGYKTTGKGATVYVGWYNFTNTAYVQMGATLGQSEVTRTAILTSSTDIARAVNDSTDPWVRVGVTGSGNNKNCADGVDHDFINVTAYTPDAACPVIDGDPETDSCGGASGIYEWNYTTTSGGCPDNKWLIDDAADDAGSDNDDIDDVWTQDDDTYFSLMLKTTGTTPDNNLRIYFDPDEDGSYECYAYTADGSTVTFSGGAGCGSTGSSYSDAGTNGYAEYKVDIDYICAAATNCCSSGADGCTATSGSTRIYVEDPDASNDRAPDSGYYDHDFSSTCDGPSNPIPELPFGAIIAILLPMIMLSILKMRKENN